jgi:hypothetical protein
MASKKKKKFYQKQKTTAIRQPPPRQPQSRKEIKTPMDPLRFAILVTAGFFVIALLGMLNHEMWRDEHQAWLVARDAHSLPQLFENMRYEGNPALWHIFLYFITCFTHNPVYMQAFHLLIACGFIFVFNRYAPLGIFYKILFSFGYFPLYEYAVISRSYGLGVLLVFIVCALYKNRLSNYILIGVILSLLANVAIFPLIISLGIAAILLFDYFFYQEKDKKLLLKLCVGLAILLVGVTLSLYQIWPDKNNSFPAPFATKIFDFPRWSLIGSKLFTTYLYIPAVQENFWNTNIYFTDPMTFDGLSFGEWLHENPAYLWTWIYLPCLLFISGIIIFIRKPLILLLYVGLTTGLLSVYYYTGLLHLRYCGHLLTALVICYWLGEYYSEKNYHNVILRYFSGLGKKIGKPFLAVILLINVIGAAVAYSMDSQYKFTTSKDAADYIRKNKLDTLTIAGITDFTMSPIASYLDKRIFYPQMNDFGSFTIWSKKRIDQLSFQQLIHSVDSLMKNKTKLLLVKDSAPQITLDGKNFTDLEHGMIAKDVQIDLLMRFEPGTVSDEKYFIYEVQKVDSSKVDFRKYPTIN